MTAPLSTTSESSVPGAFGRLVRFWLSERMLLIGVAGFLAGYLVMQSAELQMQWLVVTCLPAGIACALRTQGAGMLSHPVMRLAAVFLVWNLTVGLLRNGPVLSEDYPRWFLGGSFLLPLFLGCVWLACRKPEAGRWIQTTLAVAGFVAVAAALYDWHFHQVVANPGDRLRNPLVHQGQHPVSTAMCMSLAMVATAMAWRHLSSRAWRAGLLAVVAVMMFAVMLTLSRGALLALACIPCAFAAALAGAALLALVRGQPAREAMRPYASVFAGQWPPMAAVALVAVGFFLFGGNLATPQIPPADVTPDAAGIYRERLNPSPFEEYFARRSNGRIKMYRQGLSYLDTWDKHLTGAGLWGPESKLQAVTAQELGSSGIDHFHSIYIATYIHGGIIGSGLFLAIILLGLRSACRLVRAGRPEWFALIAFGLGALLVDGQSACSLLTHPRFESFLLWFPLVGAAAAASVNQAAGRQPSSSESR